MGSLVLYSCCNIIHTKVNASALDAAHILCCVFIMFLPMFYLANYLEYWLSVKKYNCWNALRPRLVVCLVVSKLGFITWLQI